MDEATGWRPLQTKDRRPGPDGAPAFASRRLLYSDVPGSSSPASTPESQYVLAVASNLYRGCRVVTISTAVHRLWIPRRVIRRPLSPCGSAGHAPECMVTTQTPMLTRAPPCGQVRASPFERSLVRTSPVRCGPTGALSPSQSANALKHANCGLFSVRRHALTYAVIQYLLYYCIVPSGRYCLSRRWVRPGPAGLPTARCRRVG